MRFILRRLGFYIMAAWASLTINFFLPRLIPGDPASTIFASSRGQLRPEQLDQMRACCSALHLAGAGLRRKRSKQREAQDESS